MSNNVIEFDGVTTLDIPPPRILANAAGADLKDVVVIGWKKDGSFYFASSGADAAEVNWLLDTAKLELLEASRT